MKFWLYLVKIVPLSMLQSIASMVAFFVNLYANGGMLYKARVNFALIYPDMPAKQRDDLAKLTVKKQCISYAESVKCWAMPPEWAIAQIRQVHDKAILDDAFQNDDGVLIIVPHFGTWEIMNAWLHQYGNPTIMYKAMKNPQIDQFVRNARQAMHADLVPTDAQGVKALFKALKQGGFSIILPDHVPQPAGGVIVPFFAVPCLTATLASKMAQKTRCCLVGLDCSRQDDGDGFVIHCHAFDDENLYHADIEIATTAMNQAIEKMIERSPSDYHWAYKRFKGVAEIEQRYQQRL
ncbi:MULTISPECIES: lysophospholipid acyltransferase family protein [unclassified Acinetobacter]|uniref:lysophospholipid acyltransferase family protein n=1 Tax=unclassified Acinetobacter TaxID=196816 RepID=UPI0035B87CFE